MPSNSQPSTGKVIFWVIVALFAIGALFSNNTNPAKATSGGVGSSDYGSASCREAGKKQFTSFDSPEWRDYIARCAPPGVK